MRFIFFKYELVACIKLFGELIKQLFASQAMD